jgi:hypothetical protein
MSNSYSEKIKKLNDLLTEEKDYDSLYLGNLQEELDELYSTYNNDEKVKSKIYLAYQAQAIIHFRNKRYFEAEKWINEAVILKGESYPLATNLLEKISDKAEKFKVLVKRYRRGGTASFVLSIIVQFLMLAFMSGFHRSIGWFIAVFLFYDLSIWLIYSGRYLKYYSGKDIRKILKANSVINNFSLFSIFSLLTLYWHFSSLNSYDKLTKDYSGVEIPVLTNRKRMIVFYIFYGIYSVIILFYLILLSSIFPGYI